MTESEINRVLDEAKVFFDLSLLDNEPRTTPEWILLRELGHVLEESFAKTLGDAVGLIWQSLRNRSLSAYSHAGTMIPPHSWPDNPKDGFGNWYWGQIWMNACAGFNGDLPSLPRKQVIYWLRGLSASRPGRPRKLEMAAKAYWSLYPEGHADVSWNVVAYEVSQRAGRSISAKTIMRAVRSLDKT